MALEGFDPRWKDFPDYILGITREIWEDRGIATLHHYYAPTMPVRSPGSIVLGNQNVIGATMATLAEFPDRQLLGEDVIWCGDPVGGFLSSHRILSTATHARDGVYGAATGKTLRYRVIADCAARNNQIFDEWLVRDQGAIVRQLGWDPKAYAADLIAREGGPERATRPFTPDMDVDGGYHGTGNGHPVGQRYADILSRIMGADIATVARDYDRAAQVEMPGGVTGHGWSDTDRFWMSLRAALPNARFELHHVIGLEETGFAPRAAIRWSLTGRHEGWGMFGAPTGADVHVMAISHAEFGPWGLRREWILFDETAIWKQILLKTG
ncbi:nuclear transport factor 2 family protein [uncultured Alsobacter sp.]|uniref:nuclear transport factor 2 family protein n=1 Tax=uncultured Alsobacter sp. TaxID=1748258 RepID=UPI0025FE6A35|nr:nuclear transport factor 2 family protein [uncultured Alsobacter sp.]